MTSPTPAPRRQVDDTQPIPAVPPGPAPDATQALTPPRPGPGAPAQATRAVPAAGGPPDAGQTTQVVAASPPRRPRRLVPAAIGLVVVLVAGVLWWVLSPSAPSQPTGNAPLAVPSGVGPAPAGTGKTLDVAADGSKQFRTIADAAAQAQPGDTVLIQPGSYEGFRAPTSGTDGQWITYEAAPGGTVQIDGGDGSDKGRIDLSDRSYIRVAGLSVQKANRFGIYAEDTSNIVLDKVEVADSRHGGVVFLNGSKITVQYANVHGNNSLGTDAEMEAISMDNIDGFEIVGCTVTGNGEEGIDAKYEARNGRIHGNTATDNRGPNIYIDSAHDIVVSDNKVSGASGPGKTGIMLGVEDYSDTRRLANIDIVNNVVTGNNGGGIGFFTESDGTFSDIRIINNTIVGNETAGLVVGDTKLSGTNILRNNLFAGNEQDVKGRSTAFTADHNLFAAEGIGTEQVTGVPEFVDQQAGDLHLKPGTPGTGSGSPDAAPPADIAGTARPQDRPDIGAYQTVE
jgi:parallel beta-helix repeat protein